MTYHNKYYDKTKKHHTIQGFCNSEPASICYRDLLRWKRERKIIPPQGGYQQFKTNWYQKANFAVEGDAIWWVGHATALIKIKHKTILTDPVFSERVSPVSFAGPKRRTPCACSIDELPHIDIIVISHNHYDHLDHASIHQLIKRFPSVTILVPLGLKTKLLHWGAQQVFELDWWQNITIDEVVLSAVPAKHWSRKAISDTNRTLWCGWIIEHNQRCIYFAGDTSYSSEFSEIKVNFPHIDIALIPIGSYAPRWFMANQHIDPQQALQLFHDVGCKRAIAIHWGAFELADDPLDEPPRLLQQLFEHHQITEMDFLVIKIGSYVQIVP